MKTEKETKKLILNLKKANRLEIKRRNQDLKRANISLNDFENNYEDTAIEDAIYIQGCIDTRKHIIYLLGEKAKNEEF